MSNAEVLVDSSVWIKYFKHGNSPEALHLDHLLAQDAVAVCGPIKAEILSGLRSIEEYRKISNWLDGFNNLSEPADIWQRVAQSRFRLARRGVQQTLIDLWIVWTAHEHGVAVWSLDEDFKRIKDEVPFKAYRYEKNPSP